MDGRKKIFLSAAEPSADIHCANLIKAINIGMAARAKADMSEGICFAGVGGENMAAAGCELMENLTADAAMLHNAFSQVGFYRRLIKRIDNYFALNRVELVVVCDSPSFNFHVAKAAKRHGIKVLFYVAPQLWAWAPWRMRKMRKCCDKLACILPFEQKWFVSHGVDAQFVGNPLFDDMHIDINKSRRDFYGFDPHHAKLLLLPGSRDAEIATLWKPMQKIALQLNSVWPGVTFTACAVDKQKLEMLKKSQIKGFDCRYRIGSVAAAAQEADFTLVASGSATLQVAAGGCPMIVMYQSNRILWHLAGRWLIRTRFLSLVNILAGRELVPEFMPYFGSIEPIRRCCVGLLQKKPILAKTSGELVELVRPMAQGGASEKTAGIAVNMLG